MRVSPTLPAKEDHHTRQHRFAKLNPLKNAAWSRARHNKPRSKQESCVQSIPADDRVSVISFTSIDPSHSICPQYSVGRRGSVILARSIPLKFCRMCAESLQTCSRNVTISRLNRVVVGTPRRTISPLSATLAKGMAVGNSTQFSTVKSRCRRTISASHECIG